MSSLYPELTEEAEKEVDQVIEKFKIKMVEASKDALSDIYCHMSMYVKSDHWQNFRNQLLDGLTDYHNNKINAEYDFKKIREKIYRENYEEIIKDLDKDIFEENLNLKKHCEFLQKIIDDNRRNY